MNDDRKQEPGERMRNIFASNDDEANAQFQPKSEPEPEQSFQVQSETRSPLDQLPKLKPTPQANQNVDRQDSSPVPEKSATSVTLDNFPKKRSERPPVEQPATQDQVVSSQAAPEMSRREKFLRALWTMTSVISMIINIVVIIALIVLYWAYRDIKLPEGVDITMVNKLLSGLYSNFEKMDQATIETVIPVDAQIPLDITVPVQTTTQITLSETVNIPNAQVVINTGGLNINSTARVTLPAGTPLTVNLNFNLPVQDTIPVHLDVPVEIPMADTELHEPFVGLQDVVRPLYCLVDPNATGLDTQLICR